MAARVGAQFLALCIRAIDYCPPIDITFGEYLRALVTADRDLIEDDKFGYRQELIAAFGRRHIYPSNVTDLSEVSLTWNAPRRKLPTIAALSLANLKLRDDPGLSPDAGEIAREVGALADLVTDPAFRHEFGLAAGTNFDPPSVESIRIMRRVGPDRQVRFGLVAEVLQTGRIKIDGRDVEVLGGSTIILGGSGDVRFVVLKAIDNEDRARRTSGYACPETSFSSPA